MSAVAVDQRDRSVGRHRRSPWPHRLLATVSFVYCVLVAWRTSQSMTLTYDEIVYASQVARDAPAATFSAPRARGMSLLVAPVVAITEWPTAMRVYLVALAGVSMYLAFRPWLAVFGRLPERYRYVPAIAAGLFATLWLTILYGNLAYPNLWLAFAMVAGAGYLVRAIKESPPRWGTLAGITVAFAAASLLRPTDAAATAAALFAAVVVVPAWRQPRVGLALVLGMAVGWGAWIAEAFARYNGPLARLREGGDVNQSGLTNSIPEHLAALEGPVVLCRPAPQCAGVEPVAVVWWLLLPVLVGVGLVVAARLRFLTVALVTTAAAAAPALIYLFLIDYAAPRFLLPTYGLLAPLVAAALVRLTDQATVAKRAVAFTVIAVGFLGHTAVQLVVLKHAQDRLERVAADDDRVAQFLRDDEGITPPCLVWGSNAVQIGYRLKCHSIPAFSRGAVPDSEEEAEIRSAIDDGFTVVVRLAEETEPPDLVSGWRRVDLPGTYVAYVSPNSAPSASP